MELPEGYRLNRTEPDVWSLYGPDGELVARFLPGAPDSEIEAEAEAHEERRGG